MCTRASRADLLRTAHFQALFAQGDTDESHKSINITRCGHAETDSIQTDRLVIGDRDDLRWENVTTRASTLLRRINFLMAHLEPWAAHAVATSTG